MILKPKWLTKIEAGHRMSKGLVGSWIFNEGGGDLAFDSSGNENNGMLIANARFVGGRDGPVLDLDGAGDFVTISQNLGTVWTIALWLKTDTISGGFDCVMGEDGSFSIYLENDKLEIFDGARRSQDGTIAAGVWVHAAFVATGNGFEIYIDGVKDSGALAQSAHSWNFGKIGYSGAAGEYFDGQIGSVRIYNRALIGREILSLKRDPYQMFKRGG